MAPAWYQALIAQQPTDHYLKVNGTNIHYLRWANPGKPCLTFVHGHAAHAHWWDFIAPAFHAHYDIIALDMSGAGDSDHRDEYSARAFAEEIVACANHAGHESATVVGHSFGGSMTRIAAYLFPDAINGIVIIDSAVPDKKSARIPPPMPKQRARYYVDLHQGMRRFRLRPPQPAPADFIKHHIAAHSLRETSRGFEFKLDAAVFAKMQATENYPDAASMVRGLSMPVGFIYGGQSRFFYPDAVAALKQIIEPELLSCIEAAHHHVFLDEPEAFLEQLATLLAEIRSRIGQSS